MVIQEKGVFQKLPRFNKGLPIAFVAIWLVICAFIFLTIMNDTTSVSAVTSNGDVLFVLYKDSNCEDQCTDINWGDLTPGSVKSRDVYIKNEDNITIYLDPVETPNWYPPKAPGYMDFGWDYKQGTRINPLENLRITLTLKVSSDIEGISSFGFDILINGRDRLLGDIDGDGDVDATDMIFHFSPAYGSRIGDGNYNQYADFNGNGIVDSLDLIIYFAPNYHITLSK